MFVGLTRLGGQEVLVNTDAVASVRDRAGEKPVVIMMTNGNDFEVSESFEDVTMILTQ